jgi:excisionase family DNA binding protein
MLRRPGFATISEFARMIGVSQPAVSQAVQSGRLTAYRDLSGRKWLKVLEAAHDWEANRVRFDDDFLCR